MKWIFGMVIVLKWIDLRGNPQNMNTRMIYVILHSTKMIDLNVKTLIIVTTLINLDQLLAQCVIF